MRDTIKELFQGGHPAFNDMMLDQMELYSRKNTNYAGGGSPLGNFNRVANMMKSYPNLQQGDPAVALIGMVVKQIDNVLWALNTAKFYSSESIDEHLADISVYMNILRCMRLDAQPAMGGFLWHETNKIPKK